jgi:hypothetical protein
MLRAVSQKSRPARVGHRIPSGKLGQSQIQIRTKASELLRLCQKCVLGRAPARFHRRQREAPLPKPAPDFARFQHARTRHSRRVHNRCRSHVHARTLALRQECPLDAAKRLAAACSAVADGMTEKISGQENQGRNSAIHRLWREVTAASARPYAGMYTHASVSRVSMNE